MPLFRQFCKQRYDVDVIKKLTFFLNNTMMAKLTQNCHFFRYDVIRFNERYVDLPSQINVRDQISWRKYYIRIGKLYF